MARRSGRPDRVATIARRVAGAARLSVGRLPIGRLPIGRLPIGRLPIGRLSFGHVPLTASRSALLVIGALLLVAASAVPTILGARGSSTSALDALSPGTASAAAPTAAAAASPAAAVAAPAMLPSAAMAAGPDLVDLATKALLVGALLYLTLRVLRHLQSGPATRGSRLAVLETRTLASKASIHLVSVGERRIVVGLTPAGMVALAELDAAELPEGVDLPEGDPPVRAGSVRLAGARSSALDALRGLLP